MMLPHLLFTTAELPCIKSRRVFDALAVCGLG